MPDPLDSAIDAAYDSTEGFGRNGPSQTSLGPLDEPLPEYEEVVEHPPRDFAPSDEYDLSEHRKAWAEHGIDEKQAMSVLYDIDASFRRDPEGTLAAVARLYNLDAGKLAQSLQSEGPTVLQQVAYQRQHAEMERFVQAYVANDPYAAHWNHPGFQEAVATAVQLFARSGSQMTLAQKLGAALRWSAQQLGLPGQQQKRSFGPAAGPSRTARMLGSIVGQAVKGWKDT